MSLDLESIQQESERFGALAYLATSSASNTPYVSPVVIAWHDGEVLAFVATAEAKVANVCANGKMCVHWPVSEATNWDSLIVWGSARLIDDMPGRQALWNAMGYNLDAFEPGGPEADTHVFIAVRPTKAVVLRQYGRMGRDTWRA
jgi:nitroimidazol reductase NimA-like FMN-containing flavoprotein (pyridoxamine 5'-phosphate oxidase superfamily)